MALPDLCHVFLFVGAEGAEIQQLKKLGLVPTYRRRHSGQGTANVCYCFDNAFLELLWVADPKELAACALSRSGWTERSNWTQSQANPFGIALRGDALGVPTWDYQPDYLPPGISIPVAIASDDPAVPFLFRSPGTKRPDQEPTDRSGTRQISSGFKEIQGLELTVTEKVRANPALTSLEQRGLLTLRPGPAPGLILTLSRHADRAPRRLSLPDMRWLD